MLTDKKIDELLLYLINLQLEPYSVKFNSIKDIPAEFHLMFETTIEQEKEFIKKAKTYLKKKTRMHDKWINVEIDNFILSWGLKYTTK
uniref:Uncharacterized protein n=1 Tax=viral metagenome TaxID=1070528 RepID=A0A6H2A3U3_9ZZZZ